MTTAASLRLAWCRHCEYRFLVNNALEHVHCPLCGKLLRTTLFDVSEWPKLMSVSSLEECLNALGRKLSSRQQRLMFCGLARTEFSKYRSYWFLEAVQYGERWADEGRPRFGVDDVRRRCGGANEAAHLETWNWLAAACIADEPSWNRRYAAPEVERALADAYRDIIPNPFIPLEWNPEWFTSTVRGLAAHIYEKRDFSAMPILGDALMDAGCDQQLIQEHCRSTKPHARGCWVVDAILGKS